MDLGYDGVYALGNEAFEDLPQAAGPFWVTEDEGAMVRDRGVDQVEDSARSLRFPCLAGRGGDCGGYRERRPFRIR
jgi:hypothetical protein